MGLKVITMGVALKLLYSSKFSTVVTILIILITIQSDGLCSSELRLQISSPDKIPLFDDFKTPTITQGMSDDLSFKIKNIYNFSDENTMSDVTLEIEIYGFGTEKSSKDFNELDHQPEFTSGGSNLDSLPNKRTAWYHWDTISEGESKFIQLSIGTSDYSPAGIYFVRTHLNFSFNGTYFDMRSRGHFTNDQWDRAIENITDQEGEVDGKFIAGRLDLNVLEVDGLITETSFRVEDRADIRDFILCFFSYPGYIFIIVLVFIFVIVIVYFKYKKKRENGFSEFREYDKPQQK